MPPTGWRRAATSIGTTGLLALLALTGCAWTGSELVPGVPGETAPETALPTAPPETVAPEATPPESSPPEDAPGESTIVYTVEGTGTASVTFMTVQAGAVIQQSLSGTTLPFTKSMTVASGGGSTHSALTLVAVGTDATDTLSCTITRDGSVVAEQTASGPFAAVTCTATNP